MCRAEGKSFILTDKKMPKKVYFLKTFSIKSQHIELLEKHA